MKSFFCCGLICLTLLGCDPPQRYDSLNCATVNCISGNGYFAVRFLDKTSGVDLIANGGFDTTGLHVTNGSNNMLYVANRMGIDSLKTALMFEDYSKSGINNIKIATRNAMVNFSYKYRILEQHVCCPPGEVTDIQVANYAFGFHSLGNLPANFKVITVRL